MFNLYFLVVVLCQIEDTKISSPAMSRRNGCLASYVLISRVRGDCESLKCVKKGKTGTPAVIDQFPYLTGIAEIKKTTPFCLGTLLSLKHVLTTCSCAHVLKNDKYERREDNSLILTAGGVDETSIQKRNSKMIYYHDTCAAEYMIANDFSVVETDTPFKSLGTGRFISTKDESIIKKSFEEIVKKKEKCFIFGYGTYQVLNEKSAEEGGAVEKKMERYELSITQEDCKSCCDTDKWLGKGHKCGGVGKTKCSGGTGSPVVCEGNIYGILRGHVSCKDDKNNNGPQIFIPIELGIKFFKYFYENITISSIPPPDDLTTESSATQEPDGKVKAQAANRSYPSIFLDFTFIFVLFIYYFKEIKY